MAGKGVTAGCRRLAKAPLPAIACSVKARQKHRLVSKVMPPHVTILLGSYNGARFLPQQLASFAAQTHANWSLLASDDHSGDATRAILAQFAAAHPARDIRLVEGPGQGFARNFQSLLERVEPGEGRYFSFSDQDDIWLEEKLKHAVKTLETTPAGMPALYCGRSILIDEAGRCIGRSPLHTRPPSFGNALLQNVAGGNTMVFNEAARRLAMEQPNAAIPFHDWWLYFIVAGAGGRVIYDPEPQVLYRQHGANVIGNNFEIAARAGRLIALLGGKYPLWTCQKDLFDPQFLARLTLENRTLFEEFGAMICRRGPAALVRFRRQKIYRQDRMGNVVFALALLLGVLAQR